MISSNQKTLVIQSRIILAALLELTVWAIHTCYYGSYLE